MKILRYVYEYPPPWHGLTAGPFELSLAQAAIGHEVSVICGGFPKQQTFRVPSLKVRRMPMRVPGLDIFFTTEPAVMCHYIWQTMGRSVDLVHSHNHIGLWVHLLRKYVKETRRMPFVLHLNTVAAGRRAALATMRPRPGPFSRNFVWPLHILSDRVGCQVADAVVCTSEKARHEAIRYCGVDPNKISVLPNGVNPEVFGPDGASCRLALGAGPDDAVLLYVGNIVPLKNVHLMIEALALLPSHYKLAIVGRVESPYAQGLEDQVASSGMSERVRFVGYVANRELPAYYRAANLLLLASYYEGFPKVVVESLACGTPVLTSTKFDDSAVASLVEPLKENTAECIARSARSVVERGRRIDPQLILTRFSWEAVARRLDSVYERAIARRSTLLA